MTKHVDVSEFGTRLSELVAAAVRGEEVIIDEAGAPQVRLVPVAARTIEQLLAVEKTMTREDMDRRGARRRAAFGMYGHLVKGPIPDVRDLKPTDADLDENERRKFGDPG